MSSFVSLGRLHLPLYGLVAAVGLICAMLLCLRTARLAKLEPDDLWNLGMFLVLAAFVLSRLELILENLRPFLADPMLVLELPSITLRGLWITAFATAVYLSRPARSARLPLLPVFDAAAPCLALLWAFFNLADLADGAREGLPTRVPWAIGSSFGPVHPVEIYSALAWVALCALLLALLRHARRPGETTAAALFLGGLLLYTLDFFRLPYDLYGTSHFSGSQTRGLEMMLLGACLLAWRVGVGADSSLGSGGRFPAKDTAHAV